MQFSLGICECGGEEMDPTSVSLVGTGVERQDSVEGGISELCLVEFLAQRRFEDCLTACFLAELARRFINA